MNHILRHLRLHLGGEYSSVIYLTDSPTVPWFTSIWEVLLAPYAKYYRGTSQIFLSHGTYNITKRNGIQAGVLVVYEDEPVPEKPFGGTKPKNPFAKAQPWKERR